MMEDFQKASRQAQLFAQNVTRIKIKSLTMSLTYIKEYYGVPAEKGRRVKYQGKVEGVIVGADGAYIEVVFDGNKANDIHIYHPTDRIEYLGKGNVPKMTRGQRKYQDYLKADSGLTFRQWLGIKNN